MASFDYFCDMIKVKDLWQKEYFIQLLQNASWFSMEEWERWFRVIIWRKPIIADGSKFRGQMRGNNDLLNITRPDVIEEIQHQYFESGVDIITTNTFNANTISLADYGIESMVREINLAAGKLTREAAENFMKQHPGREIFRGGFCGTDQQDCFDESWCERSCLPCR